MSRDMQCNHREALAADQGVEMYRRLVCESRMSENESRTKGAVGLPKMDAGSEHQSQDGLTCVFSVS